jgi:hypothetical protein
VRDGEAGYNRGAELPGSIAASQPGDSGLRSQPREPRYESDCLLQRFERALQTANARMGLIEQLA